MRDLADGVMPNSCSSLVSCWASLFAIATCGHCCFAIDAANPKQSFHDRSENITSVSFGRSRIDNVQQRTVTPNERVKCARCTMSQAKPNNMEAQNGVSRNSYGRQ